ncbi:hypothetical protein MRX96_058511 [Rhipicephalus microplus]
MHKPASEEERNVGANNGIKLAIDIFHGYQCDDSPGWNLWYTVWEKGPNKSEYGDGHINGWGKKTISTPASQRTKTIKIKVSATLNQTTVNPTRVRPFDFSRPATDYKGLRADGLTSSTLGTNICSSSKRDLDTRMVWFLGRLRDRDRDRLPSDRPSVESFEAWSSSAVALNSFIVL